MDTHVSPGAPPKYRMVAVFLTLVFCTIIPLAGQQQEGKTISDARYGVSIRYVQDSDDSFSFLATNPSFIPFTVRIAFPSLSNMSPSVRIPVTAVIPPGAVDQEVVVLRPGDGRGRTGFSIETIFVPGDAVHVTPDTGFTYLFPFPHGSKFEVGQGFNGRYTHSGQNQYAVDFSMPEGTPVHAARGGTVFEVKQDSDRGGPGPEFDDYGNFISVLHDDGTWGNYVHLRKDGSLVQPGDHVDAGQQIGWSGNTGRSSGPHLHFDVRVYGTDGSIRTIPMQFLSWDGSVVTPKEHEFYYATVPGEPPYQVLLGSLLKDSDFASWIARAPEADTVEVRHEQIDNAWVVFVSNGYGRNLEVSLDFQLENFRSTRGTSMKITVPAGSEVHATILRQVDPSRSSRYSVRIRHS